VLDDGSGTTGDSTGDGSGTDDGGDNVLPQLCSA
jgi:hypothetical protein